MKIAFTSCVRYEAYPNQPHWDMIAKEDPDFLFLLGDNIYMDYGIWPFSKEPIGAPEKYSDEDFKRIMESKYINQFENVPEFKSLVDKMRIKNGFFGIWDDHDFAWDNAKGNFVSKAKKDISTELFHKYLNCSTNLPHTYYKIDTPMARVIFLDNRTYAGKEGKNANLLGEEQFKFLEENINHDLPYTIVCSGLTLTAGRESWKGYPKDLKRLCEILKENKNVITLAGDIHKNKFTPAHFSNKIAANIPAQIASSGLQVNNFGIGKPFDNKHNWALLDLRQKSMSIKFFNKCGFQKALSKSATKKLNEYLTNP